MKKFDLFKTAQLIVTMILSVICMSQVLLNPAVSQKIATDSDMRLLCIMLWLVLGISFLFIFVDFTLYARQKKDFADLITTVTSDPLSRMANRFSVDSNIEQYDKNGIPEHFSCMMFCLTNIQKINFQYGRDDGNRVIQDFSMIMSLASRNLCFVGKNGGNRYLALFDEGSDEKIRLFESRIDAKIREYNADPDNRIIKYAYGTHPRVKVPQLISIS
ncbi:MAG: GGDEF domain-containing protein [Erysipelotrichia bacterium]|nr:GGDEF domain-containing protein [Erysipelotrichia bacterium]